ncbi:MAG: hypothetical protein AAGI52_10765 [Bacteroidota bacterium]
MSDTKNIPTSIDPQDELNEQDLENVAGGAENPWGGDWGGDGGDDGSAGWWNPNGG